MIEKTTSKSSDLLWALDMFASLPINFPIFLVESSNPSVVDNRAAMVHCML